MTSKREQFYKRRIAELEKQVAELLKVNAELVGKVAKLSKNSSNSSKLIFTISHFHHYWGHNSYSYPVNGYKNLTLDH